MYVVHQVGVPCEVLVNGITGQEEKKEKPDI